MAWRTDKFSVWIILTLQFLRFFIQTVQILKETVMAQRAATTQAILTASLLTLVAAVPEQTQKQISLRNYGLDGLSDDAQIVINGLEEENKEFIDAEKKKVKAELLERRKESAPTKRTIYDDHEIRYKNAMRRYWSEENSGSNRKTVKEIAEGKDRYPDLPDDSERVLERKTIEVNFETLKRHKKNVVKFAKKKYQTDELTKEQLRGALDDYKIGPIGSPDLADQGVLSNDDLTAVSKLVVKMQFQGFPLSALQISEYINDIADDIVLDNPALEACRQKYDEDWVQKKFLKRKECEGISLLKACALDPKRAAQANPEVGENFFKMVDEFLQRKHEEDPEKFKYKRLADIPPEKLYNIDEFGSHTNEKRPRVAIVKDIAKWLGKWATFRMQRSCSTMHGDKGQGFHVSVVQCSRADGRYRWFCKKLKRFIGGAVCPMIIHAMPTKGKKPGACDAGVVLPDNASVENINYTETGIKILCTKNGSMERGVFREYAKHFVSQLPSGYGKEGEMCYLFLDGHSSRWDLKALKYFEDNNVCVICLPSHTSIWSQPNDGKQPAVFLCVLNAVL